MLPPALQGGGGKWGERGGSESISFRLPGVSLVEERKNVKRRKRETGVHARRHAKELALSRPRADDRGGGEGGTSFVRGALARERLGHGKSEIAMAVARSEATTTRSHLSRLMFSLSLSQGPTRFVASFFWAIFSKPCRRYSLRRREMREKKGKARKKERYTPTTGLLDGLA